MKQMVASTQNLARHAVVIGAARNIGHGIARRLSEDGWWVFVLDSNEPEDASLTADAQRVDLFDPTATTAELERIVKLSSVT
jgi:NAD(P)-dependent dehydrogenase (short-subunit alcohol dehydrogenase family)